MLVIAAEELHVRSVHAHTNCYARGWSWWAKIVDGASNPLAAVTLRSSRSPGRFAQGKSGSNLWVWLPP